MKLPWYRPNFSKHWGNWLFVFFAFFIGFLPVKVFAADTYQYFATRDAAYQAYSAAWAAQFATGYGVDGGCGTPNGYRCSYRSATASAWTGWHYFYGADAARCAQYPAYPYEYPDGTCQATEYVPDCPSAGTEWASGMKLSSSNFSDSNTIVVSNGDMSYGGCRVQANWIQVECDQAVIEADPSLASEGCYVNAGYVYTGEAASPSDSPVPSQVTEDIPSNAEPVQDTQSSDTVDKVYGEEQTEVLVDGTEVASKTDTETEKRGAGVTVEESDPDVQIVQLDGGITKTTTTTTTTTTYPDGSKKVEKTVQQSYTDWDVEQYKVDNGDGTVTYTNVPGAGTYFSSKNTTDNYDSNGNKTSSSESSEVSGSGDAQDQDGATDPGDYCKENPGAFGCVEWEGASKDNNPAGFDTSTLEGQINAQKALFQATIDSIKSEGQSLLEFTGSGAGLGCYDFFDFGGVMNEICLSPYAAAFATIGSALLLIVLLMSLYVILK